MATWYRGTRHPTILLAARAWARDAAPDGSVFAVGDFPSSEARALRIFWDREAGSSIDLPEEDGETVDEDRWTETREVALESLIRDYIAHTRWVRESDDR